MERGRPRNGEDLPADTRCFGLNTRARLAMSRLVGCLTLQRHVDDRPDLAVGGFDVRQRDPHDPRAE